MSMGTPFLQCGRSRGPLHTSEPQPLQVAQGISSHAALHMVSAENRLFQWREISGRRVPCGDGDWALPLLAGVLSISIGQTFVFLLWDGAQWSL